MHQNRCVCPRCGTTLRVKDRSYLNRPVACPDCRMLLVLKAVEDDRLEAVLADEAETHAPPQSPVRQISIKVPPPIATRFREWSTNVTVISWTATLVVAAMIGAVAFWPKSKRPQPRPEPLAKTAPATISDTAPEESNSSDSPPVIAEFERSGTKLVDDAIHSPEQAAESPPIPVPAQSLETSIPADAAIAVADAGSSPDQPVLESAPVPLREVDFETALSQPLSAFRQIQAISRRDLLDQLEEMLGAPIRYDPAELGNAAPRLDQKISFNLQDVTVGDVLAKVLEKTEISYDRERDGLRLRRSLESPPVPGTP